MPSAAGSKARTSRVCAAASFALLLAVLLGLFVHIHEFAETRFFTVDEYQYAHATWLVAQGEVPYRDFYEHHFPGSYVLHAPLLPESGSLGDRALALRKIPFFYLTGACLLLALATWIATRSAHQALLTSILSASFGFSLMSAIDYRADNFGAFLFVACLALLEINRRRGRRSIALIAGILLALSIAMTQKMLALGGGSVLAIVAVDAMRRRWRPADADPPWLAQPLAFAAGAFGVAAIAVGAGLAFGVIGSLFELTILQAVTHEASYPPVSVVKYAKPFFEATAATTVPLLLFAALHGIVGRGSAWWIATLVVLVGGAFVKAQYPYNYVLVCTLLMVCAVRGYGFAVDRMARSEAWWKPLLYLVPLVLLPNQLAFTSGTTSNAHQLHLLDKLERFSSDEDVVIDAAGAAIFRPHSSYYWYHGVAHRTILADYFRSDLLRDLRASRAKFWIMDFRLPKVSPEVNGWLRNHYVRADGQLFALGFATPKTGGDPYEGIVDVIRAGNYSAHPANFDPKMSIAERVSIDGIAIGAEGIHLAEGRHSLSVAPHTGAGVLTPLPTGVFESPMPKILPHAPLFEYEKR